jgi:amino acid adenylation domain-containing protein
MSQAGASSHAKLPSPLPSRPHAVRPSRREDSLVAARRHTAGRLVELPVATTPRTLLDVFAESVLRFGDRTAVDASDAVLSYEQLSGEADELAAGLRAIGVGPGDRVGVRVSSGTAELYVAILGVLASGAAYVPVDTHDPARRAETIWKGASVCAVIEDGLLVTQVSRGRGGSRPVTVDDDAWVIFTSGSTGTPKGVAVSHRSAAAFVDAEARLWTVTDDDRVLAGLSVGFDASCEEMWLAWRNGATLVPAPRAIVRSGADLGPWLAGREVTVVSTVPTLAAMWDDEMIAGVRLLILGGEACPPELGWRLAADHELWNTYGPTEATVVSTAGRIRPGEPISIGVPIDGWQVAVADERGEPVPFGEPGELVIGGVGLGRYLDADLDGECFGPLESSGWERAYRTGDIVRELIDGYEFLGRRDDQVKVAGRRVELGEIEAQLRSAPGVTAAAAAVRKTAAGNTVLVGYVTGDVDPSRVRAQAAERLPDGIVPLIVPLDALPLASSGKLARDALPWPPPSERVAGVDGSSADAAGTAGALSGTAAWLAERWADQLGVVPTAPESDFFLLGGSSVAVAKLVSVLRGRFPSAAVADVYNHRSLGELAARLDQLGETRAGDLASAEPASSRWGWVQLAGVLVLLSFGAMQWLVGFLAYDRWQGASVGPQLGWGWLAAGWLALGSAPGRAMIVLLARRILLPRLAPGRYPRHGWFACRVWFVERLAEVCHLDRLAGTPWALRYARICGAQVGDGARLATLPPVTGLLSVGARATIEGEVDVHGWWIDGDELVLGELRIGGGARVGTRAVLMPGADVGADAEVEPGSVVSGRVPAGERWGGSPASYVEPAGTTWPSDPPQPSDRRHAWRAMYGVGLSVLTVLPLLAAVPGILLVAQMSPLGTLRFSLGTIMVGAPLIAASFIVTYTLLIAMLVRGVAPLLKPGWHGDDGAAGWALWFTEGLMAGTRSTLFPLYSSVYTRSWLRLLGIPVGKRTDFHRGRAEPSRNGRGHELSRR